MLFTSGKDKMYIGHELDMRAEQCFYTFFRIFCNLLEFINGKITLFL